MNAEQLKKLLTDDRLEQADQWARAATPDLSPFADDAAHMAYGQAYRRAFRERLVQLLEPDLTAAAASSRKVA